MTADFDRTAHCQYNHQCLTEIQRILTEHFWLCFDRTTFLTEHFGKLGFDRTVNGKMFCQKDALLGEFSHIVLAQLAIHDVGSLVVVERKNTDTVQGNTGNHATNTTIEICIIHHYFTPVTMSATIVCSHIQFKRRQSMLSSSMVYLLV